MASLMFILNRAGAISMPTNPLPRRPRSIWRRLRPQNTKASLDCHGNFVLTIHAGRVSFKSQ